jgi:hypothetical protein
MPSADLTAGIQAEIRGNVSGQVAVGTHILQIGSVHGGVVNVAVPEQRPVPRPRAAPVLLRPRPFPGFLGREEEVESAVAALRAARPVQLSGPPGAGKTSLLRHVAHHAVTASFPGGVAFLSALRQPADDLLQSLFEARFQTDAPLKPTRTELCLLFQGWQALVVLDDVELPREEVERIQDTAPGCTFLWSAPERQAWGETRALPLAGLDPAGARALVERELERLLDAAEQAELDALRQATGGYPLALLQSAARVREEGIPLRDVVARLRAAATPAAAGVDAVAELSQPRRDLVVLLAALGGALVLPAHAAAVLGSPGAAEELEQLEMRGLVQRQGERFRVLEPLAGEVRAKWDGAPWQGRALAYFTAWAEQHWNAPREILEESDVLLLLLEQAVDAGAWPEVLRLGRRVEGALALAGRWDAWKRVVEWLRLASEKAGDRRGVGWALHQLGTLALCAGDAAAAQTALRQALSLRESLGDREAARVTRHNLDLLAGPIVDDPADEPGARRKGGRWRKPLVAAAVVAAVGVVGVVSVMSRETSTTKPTLTTTGTTTTITAPPRVDLHPAALAFGEQTVGSSSQPIVVRLVNRGEAGLPIGGVAVSGGDFRIADDGCTGAAALRPGGECSLSVLFTPASPGPREARIAVTDPAGRPVSDVPVTGSGTPAATVEETPPDSAAEGRDDPDRTDPERTDPEPPPARLRADHGSLDFGSQRVGGAGGERRVRMTSSGGRPARVTGVRIDGDGSFQLAASTCQGAVLDPRESCTATVRFAPAAAGRRTAALVLEHAGQSGRVRVALSGAGVEEPRRVAGAAVTPADGVDFGSSEVGGQPLVRRVTVASRGSAPLALRDVAVQGTAAKDFTAVASCAGEEIAPGSTCSVAVRFTPSAAGRRTAELLVSSNDPAGPRRVPLSGLGTPPRVVVVEGAAEAKLSPERLEFPDRPVGPVTGLGGFVEAVAGGGRLLTIRSTGAAPLKVSAVRIEGEHAGDFSVGRGPCRDPVAPGKRCRFLVNFNPGKLGARRATLVVEDNTAASPRRIELAGKGVEPRDTEAPPVPQPRGAGSPDADRPATQCQERIRRLSLSWAAVSGPNDPVSYKVVFEEGPTGGPGAQGFLNTTETTVSVPGLLAGRSLRWNVRAVDAAGNESRPSPWLHVTCPPANVIR